MAPSVLHQVVAAHEALVAEGAAELLLPGVGAVVAGELVRAGELLAAFGPGARKGPLACKIQTGRMSNDVSTPVVFVCVGG